MKEISMFGKMTTHLIRDFFCRLSDLVYMSRSVNVFIDAK